MREAPALAGVTDGRPRSSGPRRPKAAAPKRSSPPSLVRRAFARPGVTIAGAVFAALMAGVVANAILFQKGHHPAPIFNGGHRTPIEPGPVEVAPTPLQPAPSMAPVAAPPIPADPAPVVAEPTAAVPAAASPRTAKPAAPVHKSTSAPHRTDSIARLIGTLSGSQSTPTPGKTSAIAAPNPRPRPSAKASVAGRTAPPQN